MLLVLWCSCLSEVMAVRLAERSRDRLSSSIEDSDVFTGVLIGVVGKMFGFSLDESP